MTTNESMKSLMSMFAKSPYGKVKRCRWRLWYKALQRYPGWERRNNQ